MYSISKPTWSEEVVVVVDVAVDAVGGLARPIDRVAHLSSRTNPTQTKVIEARRKELCKN